MNKQIIVDTLNRLIEAANKNGGDLGGSYNQNIDELKSSIKNAMNVFTLNDDYVIIKTGNRKYYTPYLIARKDDQHEL